MINVPVVFWFCGRIKKPFKNNVLKLFHSKNNIREKQMVKFLFRKAIFPILIETDKRMFGIPTPGHFDKLKTNNLFQTKKHYKVIDGSGEGWAYYPEHDVISPLTIDKRWTKKQIIDLFNAALKSQNIENQFVCKSLSNKRLDEIIYFLVQFSIGIEKQIKNK